MKGPFIALMLLLFSAFTFCSVLSNLASGLSPHRWGLMPNNTTLGNLSLHYSLLFWNDSGVWDPLKKKIRWIGGPGTCCANPAIYIMITYDVENNVWQADTTPFTGLGHAYDGNAFNPITGVHYFAIFGSPVINVWNDTTWSILPTAPTQGTTPSITWFPELYEGRGGLVFLGNSGNLATFNGTSWTLQPSIALSGINSFSEYNPVLKKVWLGGGESPRANFLMDSAFNVVRQPDAPIDLANGSSMHVCDPVSGKFLVLNRINNTWWEYNPMDTLWTQITYMKPSFLLNNTFAVQIPEMGVVAVFNHASSAKNVYVYKHTAVTTQEKAPALTGSPLALEAMPNPTNGQTAFRLSSGEPTLIKIYNLNGRCVEQLATSTLNGSTVWHTLHHSAGVYLAVAKVGHTELRTRLTILH